MTLFLRAIFLVLVFLPNAPLSAQSDAQTQKTESRLSSVESRVSRIDSKVQAAIQKAESRAFAMDSRISRIESKIRAASAAAGVAFLFAAFCALWAQNTGRSAWLWFFLGLLFNVITVIVLLVKNAGDLDAQRQGGNRKFNLSDFRTQ